MCSVLFSYDEGATTKIEYKRIEGGRKKAKRKRAHRTKKKEREREKKNKNDDSLEIPLHELQLMFVEYVKYLSSCFCLFCLFYSKNNSYKYKRKTFYVKDSNINFLI